MGGSDGGGIGQGGGGGGLNSFAQFCVGEDLAEISRSFELLSRTTHGLANIAPALKGDVGHRAVSSVGRSSSRKHLCTVWGGGSAVRCHFACCHSLQYGMC